MNLNKRKSVCMLVTSELDGDPRVQKEALIAHQQGYDVTVLCRSYSGNGMPYKVHPVNMARANSRLAKYLERARTNWKLFWHSCQARPGIVHANDLDTLPAAFLASWVSGAKLVYDAHELWSAADRDVGSAGRRIARLVEAFMSKRADSVITVGDDIARRMSEILDIPLPAIVRNAPWLLPDEQKQPLDWLKRFEGKKVVLFQGKYVDKRGIPDGILAMRHLPESVVLVYRGYGPIEGQLRDLARAEKMDGRVFFLPAVPMNDMVRCAVGADIGLAIVSPFTENLRNALPNKFFEYIMAGLPVIASDVPNIKKLLESTGVGASFRAGDPEDMARVILETIETPGRLEQYRENARRAANTYCWETEGATLLQEYERVLSA